MYLGHAKIKAFEADVLLEFVRLVEELGLEAPGGKKFSLEKTAFQKACKIPWRNCCSINPFWLKIKIGFLTVQELFSV